MNRKEAVNLLTSYLAAVRAHDTLGHTEERWDSVFELYNAVLDAMTATTIEQNVGTIEAGATVTGVKIDRLG